MRRSYVDYLERKWKGTTESRLKDLSPIVVNKGRYCATVISNGELVNYHKMKRCASGKNICDLSVARYTFSRVLYTNNKKNGLLIIRQKWGDSAGYSKVWAVYLHLDGVKWKIEKMDGIIE